MVSRRKKKIRKTLAGHLTATGVDGNPLFEDEQAKKDFLDKLKKNEFTKQEILQIALDPDGDSYSWDKDAFPFAGQENKDTDGDGIGDNEDIIFTKFRLDDILQATGIYFGKEWSINILPEAKRRQVDGVFQVLDPSTPEDLPGGIKSYAIVRPIEADDEIERLRLHPFQPHLTEDAWVRYENPALRGGFGAFGSFLIVTKAVLDEIMTLGTPAERFAALTTARDGEYAIPTASEGRDSTIEGINATQWFFFTDFLCLYKNWNKYFDLGYLNPLNTRYAGAGQDTVNEINRLKEELLSMSPDTSGTISFDNGDIDFPSLIVKNENTVQRYYKQMLNADGQKYVGDSRWSQWYNAYLVEGGAEMIIETVLSTDYEAIINQINLLLDQVIQLVKDLDQEAKNEGFIVETPRSFTIDEWVSFGYNAKAFEDIDC